MARDEVVIDTWLPERVDSDRQRSLTDLRVKTGGGTREQASAETAASVSAGRLGTGEEFGAACAFLCSTHASSHRGSPAARRGIVSAVVSSAIDGAAGRAH